MQCRQVLFMLTVAAIIHESPAQAQPYPDAICRVASAEVADYVEGIGWTNNVTDMDSSCVIGGSTLSAEVSLGVATVGSGQTTVMWSTMDSFLVAGSMFVRNIQSGVGDKHYFFPYASVGGTFVVTSDGSYSLHGRRPSTGHVQLYIIKETDERITVDVPLGDADFEYSGSLMGAGLYEFYFGIDHLYASSTVVDQHATLEFELSIYRPTAVSVERSEWGTVKAQYR